MQKGWENNYECEMHIIYREFQKRREEYKPNWGFLWKVKREINSSRVCLGTPIPSFRSKFAPIPIAMAWSSQTHSQIGGKENN